MVKCITNLKQYFFTFVVSLCTLYTSTVLASDSSEKDSRPNVIVIVADDLGFNDLGYLGSEIQTPNLDALANKGVVLNNFHTAPFCSPTRAMLLSGTDNHIAGLGIMAEDLTPELEGKPGYEGSLNTKAASLPELFKAAGYHTYMTGKWHLGHDVETSPEARGFDKSFVLTDGGAGAFSNKLRIFGAGDASYREGKNKVGKLASDFYSTEFYTNTMIDYIEKNRKSGSPFFGYLAYSAPHWPLQAPRSSIDKYKGKYDKGYDDLHQKRLKSLQALGLFEEDVKAFPPSLNIKPWQELTSKEQKRQSRIMEVYAAMVDDLDQYVGKLVSYLKTTDQYDNTIIVFMSDNGPEGNDIAEYLPGFTEWINNCCNNDFNNIGNADSYVWLGAAWARAGSAPLRMFKGYTSQGGLRVPAFFHYPKSFKPQKNNQIFTHVKDVMPTLLAVADIKHPGAGQYRGREVVAMQGDSILPLLTKNAKDIKRNKNYTGWELNDYRALRSGDWKIYYSPKAGYEPLASAKKWQLFNLAIDPTEVNDLAQQQPKKLSELLTLWESYVNENGVILLDQ
ncbi:arylsulfatase [Pseudoalteromonas neustonica]|uniref:Arylsulfatase n=1 Tax=Pseudoalteromonas neustonica TaxID=1840331 RepID=A0ABU9TZG3_9GAMM